MQTRSQIATRWMALGMAMCAALLIAPARGQIRQMSPEGQLACQALEQTSGIRSALASALAGEAEAFPKLAQHLDVLRTLMSGNLPPSLDRLEPLVSGLEFSGKVLLQKKEPALTVQTSLREVIRESLVLVSQAQEVAANEHRVRRARTRVEAAQYLPTLLENLSRHAGKIAAEGSPEGIFDLGRDLNTFMTLSRGLIHGNVELKIPAVDNAQQRARLEKLVEDFGPVRASAGRVLFDLQGYIGFHESIQHIRKVSDELASGLHRVCYAPAIRVEPSSQGSKDLRHIYRGAG